MLMLRRLKRLARRPRKFRESVNGAEALFDILAAARVDDDLKSPARSVGSEEWRLGIALKDRLLEFFKPRGSGQKKMRRSGERVDLEPVWTGIRTGLGRAAQTGCGVTDYRRVFVSRHPQIA